jgi:beta-glucuronidase
MKKIAFLILLIIALLNLSAQEKFASFGVRPSLSLDGSWKIIIDPYENGYYDYRWEESPYGFFKNEKPQHKWDRIEYDFDKSDSLTVPGDWNSQKKELFLYEGTVWYKKSFDFHKQENMRVFLRFGAVNYRAVVYLNGKKLGSHEGGFTPFSFEITPLVREKDNFVIVKADNKRCAECVPTLNTDWWNYGGITRSVAVVETPDSFIGDYFIQLDKGSVKNISGWVQGNSIRPGQPLTVDIPELKIHHRYTVDSAGSVHFSFQAPVKLWSPEHPVLYDVILASGTDTVRDRIGFRNIEVKGTQIYLNGNPVFLRGISIHEEAPFRSGRANSRDDARTLLGWAKELGCNFVRLAHYPHNEHMLDEADRIGLMVWSEIPVYWTIRWENAQTYINASRQLSEMITRDRNRASVICWSVSNETPLSIPRLEFLKDLFVKPGAWIPPGFSPLRWNATTSIHRRK